MDSLLEHVTETTPARITPEILDFCREIDEDAQPRYVPVIPAQHSILLECHENVKHQVRRKGGRAQQGRIIWEVPGQALEAEHHSLWVSPKGKYIDITPHEDGEAKVLFLPSNKVIYDGSELIRPIYRVLTEDSTTEFVQAVSRAQFEQMNELFKRQGQVSRVGGRPGRNDPCPCGSGVKYKRCCMQK